MRVNRNRALAIFIFFCLFSTGLYAGQDRWTTTGPEGGYITAVAINPSEPGTLYVSTLGGGIFRTIDAGEHWTAVNSGVTSFLVRSLAIDRTNPSTLYAGTESDLLKSVDEGQSWTSILHAPSINEVVVDPANHSTVYAASNDGVFASVDAGATWTRASNGLPNEGNGPVYVLTVAIDPQKPNQLYASTFHGLFRTANRGQQWTAIGGLNVGPNVAVPTAIVVDPSTSSRIYLAADEYIAVTTDGGKTWATSQLNTQVRNFLIDPSHVEIVYAASDNGVFRSANSGQTWQKLPATSEPIEALVFDPSNPAILYAGASGPGVLRSNDGAATWTVKNSGLTAGYTNGIAMDPANPSLIYAGSAAGIFKSDDRGNHWTLSDGSLRAAVTLSIDPVTPSTVYAGNYQSVVKTTDGGGSWKEIHPNIAAFNAGGGASQLAIDPLNTSNLYAALADSGISKSTNGGETWMLINDGLTLGYYGFSADALAIDPTNPSTIFAASEGVARTTNAGANWTPVSNDLFDTASSYFITPNALAIDPSTPSIVYAATWRGLFRTVDSGQHWTRSDDGLQSETVTGVAIDPSDPSTVYVAMNDRGIFRSTDRGLSWSQFNAGLLTGSVQSIAVDATGRFLAAGASNGVFTYDVVSRLPVDFQTRQLPDDPSRVPRLIERLKTVSARPGFIIVPSGTVSGAHGAHFRSDVTIVNGAATTQEAMLIWLPAGSDGRTAHSFQITLPPSATTTVAGFVEKLGVNGLGALVVLAIDATGDIDSRASISGSSRIWTIGPNNPGTVSESVAGVALGDVMSHAGASAGGLRHDQDFRTNIGIVNLDTQTHTFTVDVAGERYSTSFSIDVAPLSMSQVPVPAGDYGAMHAIFQAGAGFPWTAYGSSIDNMTGEGSLVPAR